MLGTSVSLSDPVIRPIIYFSGRLGHLEVAMTAVRMPNPRRALRQVVMTGQLIHREKWCLLARYCQN